jgi:hypothetical protein
MNTIAKGMKLADSCSFGDAVCEDSTVSQTTGKGSSVILGVWQMLLTYALRFSQR